MFSRYLHFLLIEKINEVYEQMNEQQTRYTLRNDGNLKKLALYIEFPFTCGIWNSRSNVELSENFYRNSTKRVNDFGLCPVKF